ncbi:GNAT family N-acetyltransferase [Streptomyces sp. NPDC007088]|uniref:GNAT family N-acetyltransferase n=1 Tax=Streptomyces sp. NPDC007088 TaxID=3364773 RepID=UPI00368097B6
MTTAQHPSHITIRPVRADELDPYMALTLLIDLHLPADELPAVRDLVERTLRIPGDAFSHVDSNHFLFAEAADGTPVGAIHVGPPHWMCDLTFPRHTQRALATRVSNIDTIAIHPDHRRQGIATALLTRVEDDYRRAGFRALTLRHEHGNKHFFTASGYTSLSRLAMDVPPFGLVSLRAPGWKYAVKLLDPAVTFTNLRGFMTVSGLLD